MLTADGKPVVPGKLLGKGGQGSVYSTSSHRGMVFKQYTVETLAKDPTLARRLRTMISASPPERIEASSGHMVLAWPDDIVLDGSHLTGFLMPEVDMANTVELHRVTNPSDRSRVSGANAWVRSFTWQYLVQAAANLAHATQVLHDAGVVIGDFNLKNIRVSKQALVTLIDCDSMQLTDKATGETFLCPVVMPEFLPPELVGSQLNITYRHPSGDLYALAIHLYQLLLEGEHPFRGVWLPPGEDKPEVPQLARDGMWALRSGGKLAPRRAAIGADILPPKVLELFRRAFEDGAGDPDARPLAGEWREALTELGRQLRQCADQPHHWFVTTLSTCPWCRHGAIRMSQTQTALPPVAMPPMAVPLPPPAGPQSMPVPYWSAPTPRPRPAGKLILAGVLGAVVLVCGIGAIASTLAANKSDTTAGTTAGTAAGGSSDEDDEAVADTSVTQTDTGGQPDAGAVAAQAQDVRDLLSSSGAARRSIQSAIADVRKCGDLAGDAAVFAQAAASRSEHRDQAGRLEYSALPNGDQLRQTLLDALTASFDADNAYETWATDLESGCTRSAAAASPNLTAATDHSKTANSLKKTFVSLWNPICQQFSWADLQDTDI